MSPLVPSLLAAAALLTLCLPPAAATRVRALGHVPVPAGPPLVPLAAVLAGVTLGLAAAAAVLAGAAAVRVVARRSAAARAARDNAAAVPAVCRAVAAELRAGAPPPLALARAADEAPAAVAGHLRVAAAAGRLGLGGEDEPPPGAERLRAVATLWAVAGDAGAGLADGLDRLAEALAAEQRQRADVAAQLAGPRASAAVLAGLPVFGLALAGSLGAQPLRFLATPAGLACAGLAAALDVAGVWWVRRITERACR